MVKQCFPKNSDNQPTLYVYRPWRRNPKTGKVLWAKDYGLKAWRIPIKSKELPSN